MPMTGGFSVVVVAEAVIQIDHRNMLIRPAEPSDIQPIAEIHAASWRYAYQGALSDQYLSSDIVSDRADIWTKRLTTTNTLQYVVVADSGSQLAGFACAFAEADPEWGTLLDNIHVVPDRHRQGIGADLMYDVANWHIAQSPSRPMFLWVLQTNWGAQRFYETLGAENVGEGIWTPPGGGEVPRFRYAWRDVRELFRRLAMK